MEEIKVRKDLNEIVKSIGFKHEDTKYGARNVVRLKLFNDAVFEIKDKDGLYDLLKSYSDTNKQDFIKSRELVEEVKNDDEGNPVSTYICVKYVIQDEQGTFEYRLFPSFIHSKAIINYYNEFKSKKKVVTPSK